MQATKGQAKESCCPETKSLLSRWESRQRHRRGQTMLGTAKAKLKQPGEMEMRKKWKKKPGGEIAKYSREKEEKYEPFH